MSFFRWGQRSSEPTRNPSPDPLPGELLSMEQLFSLPIEQTQDPSEPAVTAREIRQSRRNAHMRPSLLGSDPAFAGNGSTFRMSVFGMHGGRLFSTFTGRRNSSQPTSEALSYESMLALDENNPKRGVKKHVLDKLHMAAAGRADADKECHICMERFKRTSKLLHLPCSHSFCDGCIRQWLHNHRTCPLCRFQFPDKDTHFV